MIEVGRLLSSYPRATAEPTLKGIRFAVERGEILGSLGPSGAGKSHDDLFLLVLVEKTTPCLFC